MAEQKEEIITECKKKLEKLSKSLEYLTVGLDWKNVNPPTKEIKKIIKLLDDLEEIINNYCIY